MPADHGPYGGVGPLTGPDLGAPVRLALVRHGRTAATDAGLLSGRGGADPALTEEGRAALSRTGGVLARQLPGALVVCSPLVRARESAGIVGTHLGVAPVVDERWAEQHFGDWEGRTVAEACADPEAYARLRTDPTYARPGGESRNQVRARVLAAYDDAVALGAQTERPVVIVSHRAALLTVLDAALGLRSPLALTLDPGSVTWVRRWADGGVAVDGVNDIAHLRDMNAE